MNKWKKVKISDSFILQMGKTPSRNEPSFWNNPLYNWVSISDMNQKYICSTKEKISPIALEKTGIKKVPKGTIMLSFKLSLGKVSISALDLYTNEAIMSFFPKNKNEWNIDFLYNYFKWLDWGKKAQKAVKGSTLNKNSLGNIEIPLPAMEEQKKIAARLDAVSDLLAKQKQLLAEQDTLIQSTFYDMFGDLKCEESTIGNECILKSGTTFSKDDELDKGEYIYAKVADMNLQGNEVYIKTSRKYLSKKHVGNLFLNKGSIIFPKRGGAIRTNKKRILIEDSCVDLNIMGVSPRKKLTTQYLYVYFLNLNLESLCDGCVIPQINNKNIAPLKIPVPPLELQEKFAAIVEQIESEKSKIKSTIAETQTLFNAMMSEYFEE